MNYWVLVGGFLVYAVTAVASPVIENNKVRVYGPGGPHHVLQECADRFEDRHGIEVEVVKALPHDLGQKLCTDGDIYYGGAEYMLEEFNQFNPGILDMTSVEMLYPRQIGVIVRKGNPHNIQKVEDIARNEVKLLDVKLENMRQFHEGGTGKISHFTYTGQEGFNAWKSISEIGAWVTYKSWHVKLDDDSEFIEITDNDALRYTPIALTQRTTCRDEALLFLSFLKTEEAQKIFLEHGWECSLPGEQINSQLSSGPQPLVLTGSNSKIL